MKVQKDSQRKLARTRAITSVMQGLFGASLSEKHFVGLESKAIDRDWRQSQHKASTWIHASGL
jgi:hypothetical protein